MTTRDPDCCIYVIRFPGSSREYIGKTVNLKSRKRVHLRLMRSGTHYNKMLNACYTKYGEPEFYILKGRATRRNKAKERDQ